jgi:acylpyruvate hydrolase
MRFTVFKHNDQTKLGLRIEKGLIDLSEVTGRAYQDVADVLSLDSDGLSALETAAKASDDGIVDETSITLLPPVGRPGKIVCLGLNYYAHAAEGGHDKPEYPSFFMRVASSLVGHGQPIIRPKVSEQLDYEAELVAVVGKTGRHVKREDGLSIIAGYSVFNDASIRHYQRLTSQWTIGKNFDGTGGFGPEYVTADELPEGCKGLQIQTRLNGEVLQDSNTDNMIFDVAETVELLTECMTLEPGDLIVMGTPSGVGHARTPQLWMKPGDICEIDIEQVGVLSNPIEDEVA